MPDFQHPYPERAADRVPAPEFFDEVYEGNSAPWIIGTPQPVIVEVERDGWIRGRVLDCGCGTGEHTIHLARLGYDVLGVDASRLAVERATANAARQGVEARFQVADALNLTARSEYDTIVDSALFHIFDDIGRARYTESLYGACREGALVHLLGLSDAGPKIGPQINDTVIRTAFASRPTSRWEIEDLRPSSYRCVLGPERELTDQPAWLARIRRL